MKKPSRSISSHATPLHGRHGKHEGKKDGPWEFTSSGSLFFLGTVAAVRRAAYQTATGELRFLPI